MLVSKRRTATIGILKGLRDTGTSFCVLLMLGGGHVLAQPNQNTSPDRELSTIQRELRLFSEEFNKLRPTIDSKAELEAEAAKFSARETEFRQKCLNLAERNPGSKAEVLALYIVAGGWPKADEGQLALQILTRISETEDLTHLGVVFESSHALRPEGMRPLIPVLLRRERQNPDHPFAAKLLTEACGFLKPSDDKVSVPSEFTEIADRIVERHATSPKLSNFCEYLGKGYGSPRWAKPFESHLRRILDVNGDRFVRCSAKMALASVVELGADRQSDAVRLYEEFLEEFDGTVEHVAKSIEVDYRERAQFNLERIRTNGIGMETPKTVGLDLDGNPMVLSDHHGKVVLITFWATWCAPCMRMIPHEKELIKRFSADKFVIAGVNGDFELLAAQKAIALHQIPWRSFQSGEGSNKIADQWHVTGWPTLYLVDANGIIRKRWDGEPPVGDLSNSIESLIEGRLNEMQSANPNTASDTQRSYPVIEVSKDVVGATGFVEKTHHTTGTKCKYVVFIPHNYQGKPTPAILFLHGAGSIGTDGRKQLTSGLANAISKREKEFPFIAIFPQSQEGGWLADEPDGKRAVAILAEVYAEYAVDLSRVYLTGMSMGGEGTWSLAAVYPDSWAAIVPLCGGGDPSVAPRIKHIPCWCFQGDADRSTEPMHTFKMVEAIRKAGGQPMYHVYPGVEHNCWDLTYERIDLYEWLLSQQRSLPN